jgi:hypothetical protein
MEPVISLLTLTAIVLEIFARILELRTDSK